MAVAEHDGFEALARLIRSRSGIAIGPDKLYLMQARLQPVLRRLGLAGLGALAETLRDPRQEALAREVVEAMTTNESSFFRDGRPFDHFRDQLLPRLLAQRPAGARLRLWSAAASSGQEAYSLAMILAEQQAQLGGRAAEILGTDLCRAVLERARQGLYTGFEVQRGLPPVMLARYFRAEGAQWRVQDRLRAMVRFQPWNLLHDPAPLGRFDVIFCRNVLIYFDPPTKARVLAALAAALAPDGVLYLGGAETAIGLAGTLRPVPGQAGVFEPVPAGSHEINLPLLPISQGLAG